MTKPACAESIGMNLSEILMILRKKKEDSRMRQFVSRLIAAVLIAGFVLMAGTDYAKADAASVPEILDYETDDAEPSMQQKPLSAGAKNQTKSIQPFGTKSRRADKVFAGAMANASVKLLQKTMKTDKTGGNILISPD